MADNLKTSFLLDDEGQQYEIFDKQAREDIKALQAKELPVKSVNGKTGAVVLAASDVGARPDTWTPSASDVGADPSGTAAAAVTGHNTNTDAHNDIRLLIEGLTTRLNTLANSDDTTLDQMAEVVAYIKSNRTLIESVTTGKVSVTDIINNLTTNVTDKPLAAAQGVVLKSMIDNLQTLINAIKVPTKTSELTDDVGFAKQTDVNNLSEEIVDLKNAGYVKQTEMETYINEAFLGGEW